MGYQNPVNIFYTAIAKFFCFQETYFLGYGIPKSSKYFLQGASLAQQAARQSHNLKVVSSILTRGTFFFTFQVMGYQNLVNVFYTAIATCKLSHSQTVQEKQLWQPLSDILTFWRFRTIIAQHLSETTFILVLRREVRRYHDLL